MANTVSFKKVEIKRLYDIMARRWLQRHDKTRGGPECPKRIKIEEDIFIKLLEKRGLID